MFTEHNEIQIKRLPMIITKIVTSDFALLRVIVTTYRYDKMPCSSALLKFTVLLPFLLDRFYNILY